MVQKILICGFPHCGTSILKSIFGYIDDVEEIQGEYKVINKSTNKKFILCKWPFTENIFFGEKYKDYIKIFIIRNPLFVFSSLNKRFNYKIPKNHSFNVYVNTMKLFIEHKNNFTKNVFTIRYEDMFKNNYQMLKNIIDNIGIKYDDMIFENKKYKNVVCSDIKLMNKKPKNINHRLYRTWQINQPFISNNNISKIDLKTNQKKLILNNSHIIKVYPKININFKKNI